MLPRRERRPRRQQGTSLAEQQAKAVSQKKGINRVVDAKKQQAPANDYTESMLYWEG